jgi:hypothetical protein
MQCAMVIRKNQGMQSTTVVNTGIEIRLRDLRCPGGRLLLLVMGLGAQMIAWRPELCGNCCVAGRRRSA